MAKYDVEKTPWITEDGIYRCHSDHCPIGLCGSGKCPLDVQTTAIKWMNMGDFRRALECMCKVVLLAPDFAQGWFNLGVCYGNLGDDCRARNAFQTALSYDPDYEPAIRGLELAESKINGGAFGVESIQAMDILEKLIQLAVKHEDMRECAIRNVPELMPYADDIGEQIMQGLEEFRRSLLQENDFADNLKITISWSLFAGIGAVLEWQKDWPTLKRKGLYEKLCEKRGINAMDEYVIGLFSGEEYDIMGGKTSKVCDDLNAKVHLYSTIIVAELAKRFDEIPKENILKFIKGSLPELSRAAYLFGMAYALENTKV